MKTRWWCIFYRRGQDMLGTEWQQWLECYLIFMKTPLHYFGMDCLPAGCEQQSGVTTRMNTIRTQRTCENGRSRFHLDHLHQTVLVVLIGYHREKWSTTEGIIPCVEYNILPIGYQVMKWMNNHTLSHKVTCWIALPYVDSTEGFLLRVFPHINQRQVFSLSPWRRTLTLVWYFQCTRSPLAARCQVAIRFFALRGFLVHSLVEQAPSHV